VRRRWLVVGIGSFLVTLILLLTIVFPAIDPRYNIFKILQKEEKPPSLEAYGDINAAVTSSYEWDPQEGRTPDVERVNNSQYYALAFAGESGTEYHGYLRTIQVWDSNGTIKQSVISTFEFKNSLISALGTQPFKPDIIHVPGSDIYAVAFDDFSNAKVNISTFRIYDSNGTIKQSLIDYQLLTQNGTDPCIRQVLNHIYVVGYREPTTDDGWLETIWINTTGTINNSVIATKEYDNSYGVYPSIIMVDSDTALIVYKNASNDGCMRTWNITSSGSFGATYGNSWEFDTADNTYCNGLQKVDYNTFAIFYTTTSYAGLIGTVNVSSTGTITKSWADSLNVGVSKSYSNMFTVNTGSIYGVTYAHRTTAYQNVSTIGITPAGAIDAAFTDTLVFDSTLAGGLQTSICYVAYNTYLLVEKSSGSDGWAFTVNISTNYASPVFSNEQPANGSVNIHIQPRCNITIADQNGDSMVLSWFSNTTGSWVHYQTNSSCANGTYRWASPFASYSTKYWWKIYCNDTLHNSTAWYCFTTEAEPVSETWQVINSSYNGSIKNNTAWRGIIPSCEVNGSIKNSTAWRAISTTINGSIKNVTIWKSIIPSCSINGSIKNITQWRTIIPPCLVNGSIKNSTAWRMITNVINGSIKNITGWFTVSITINGSIKNLTAWRSIVPACEVNGSIKNISIWFIFNNTINGSIKNITIWKSIIPACPINGSIKNISGWIVISSSINGSIKNITLGVPSPFNVNLHVHNPNPGNGTHSTNYVKMDATGLTTSVDLWYQNFTTPPAMIPGAYNLMFDSTTLSNGPSIENDSGVYANVWAEVHGRPIPGNMGVGQYELAGDYMIMRSYLCFDTSSLPDEAVITSAYVSLVPWFDGSDTDFNVMLQNVKPPAPHNPLVAGDYEKGNFPPLATYAKKNSSSAVVDGWFNLSLNASAIGDISLTGDTDMITRSDQDVLASAPGVGVDEWIIFYGPGGATPAYSPHLIINFTIPSSNWQHIVNLTFYTNESGVWNPYNTTWVQSNGTVTVPAPGFDGVGRYWWNVSYNSNHTNQGNTSYWWFETVATGGGSTIVIGGDGSSVLSASYLTMGLMIGTAGGLLLWRRKRKRGNKQEELLNNEDETHF
jgi:hypothetical protein